MIAIMFLYLAASIIKQCRFNIVYLYLMVGFVSSILTSGSNKFNENCDVVASSNRTYYIKIWVLVPFATGYKFAKDRLQPALELAMYDVKDDLIQNHPEYFSILRVSDHWTR